MVKKLLCLILGYIYPIYPPVPTALVSLLSPLSAAMLAQRERTANFTPILQSEDSNEDARESLTDCNCQ